MAPKSKQAERNASKRAAKKTVEDEPEAAVNKGDIVGMLKTFALESVLATTAPKLPAILKEEPGAAKTEKPEQAPEKAPEGEGGDGEGEGEAKADEQPAESKPEGPETAADVFERLAHRLLPLNGLGLWHSAAGAKEAFLKTKALKFDGGPKAKKKGSPAMERIVANGRENMLQYFHILFALMLLRSFLFRSWFAFLPWMFFYQTVSVMLPLTNLEKLPQVPLEKCPVKFRVAGTIGLHALVWFFFLYEVLFRTYIFEKILLVGLFAAHGYLVAPVEP